MQTTLAIAGPPGARWVSLLIEQTTSQGPYWAEVSRLLQVGQRADLVLFGDAVEDGWRVRPRWLANLTRHPEFDGLPAWSLDGGHLGFRSDRDGNGEIYTMRADGSNPVRLTDAPGNDSAPKWSPDGQWITFTSTRDGNGEIYTMNPDGSDPVNLTQHPAFDGSSRFSPDGTQIVFDSNRDGNWEVYTMNVDGSDPVNLTQHPADDFGPAWSPDGQALAFSTTRDGNREIYAMQADGTQPVNLTHHPADDQRPVWSPDGQALAFSTDRDGNEEIYAMRADGTQLVNLTHHPASDQHPAWSPDGRYIAYQSNRDGNWDVYVIEREKSERIALQPNQGTVIYQGASALQIQTGGDQWQLLYERSTAVDVAGYAALRFAFHPGDADIVEETFLQVGLGPRLVEVLGGALEGGIDPAVQDWQVVDLPLDLFNVHQPIEAIVFTGNLHGTFYLDDVRLVTSAAEPVTAVLETHDEAVPQDFALAQNYPNPFNAGTVIRFALPAAGQVDLGLYNLAGQKVAALVQGRRPAGAYKVRWDGRDDQGSELASGLYLYRLQAGQQVKTRKLLLLR